MRISARILPLFLKSKNMNANIWFYTFSTSAQVMASLVGLFAVFVVYKIQDFGELLSWTRDATVSLVTNVGANTSNYIAVKIQDTVTMNDEELLKKFRELLDIKLSEPDRIKVDPSISIMGMGSYALNEDSFNLFNRLVVKKKSILSQLKKTLVLSFIIIALSILALVMTCIVSSIFVLWGFTLLFLCTLFEIARGIYDVAIQ